MPLRAASATESERATRLYDMLLRRCYMVARCRALRAFMLPCRLLRCAMRAPPMLLSAMRYYADVAAAFSLFRRYYAAAYASAMPLRRDAPHD